MVIAKHAFIHKKVVSLLPATIWQRVFDDWMADTLPRRRNIKTKVSKSTLMWCNLFHLRSPTIAVWKAVSEKCVTQITSNNRNNNTKKTKINKLDRKTLTTAMTTATILWQLFGVFRTNEPASNDTAVRRTSSIRCARTLTNTVSHSRHNSSRNQFSSIQCCREDEFRMLNVCLQW